MLFFDLLNTTLLLFIKAKLGIDHPDTLLSMQQLAILFKFLKDYRNAEPLLRECLELSINKQGIFDYNVFFNTC